MSVNGGTVAVWRRSRTTSIASDISTSRSTSSTSPGIGTAKVTLAMPSSTSNPDTGGRGGANGTPRFEAPWPARRPPNIDGSGGTSSPFEDGLLVGPHPPQHAARRRTSATATRMSGKPSSNGILPLRPGSVYDRGSVTGIRRRGQDARRAATIRSRRTRRRSRSDIPPQMPNFSPFTMAYSRQSVWTSQAPQMPLARRVDAPRSGKNSPRPHLGSSRSPARRARPPPALR
jgi:hypothetical protein